MINNNKNNDKGWVTVGETPDETTTNENKKERTTFEVNGKTVDPYAMEKTHKIPVWVKALVAKWWCPGAVFYFISFGIEGLKQSNVLALILGLVWGAITDILLNHFFKELSSPGHDYTKFILCGRTQNSKGLKRFITLPINLIYGCVISYLSAYLINLIIILLVKNGAIASSDEFMFSVGPLFYATFMMIFDVGCCYIRNLCSFIKRKYFSKKENQTIENSQENVKEDSNEKPLDGNQN